MARVPLRGLRRERVENLAEHRQPEHSLHVPEPEGEAVRGRERRTRLAGPVQPGVVRPGRLRLEDAAPVAASHLLEVGEHLRAVTATAGVRDDVDHQLGAAGVVQLREP